MDRPKFPQGFLKHCPKVKEAAGWHKHLRVEATQEDLEAYADCAFHSAGAGLECENCRLFMTRPFLGHKLDEEWLEKIEDFYRRLDEYDAWLNEEEAKRALIELELGAGI